MPIRIYWKLKPCAATIGENYMSDCAVCHLPGIAGSPKVGDKAEWTRRVRGGINTLYRNAIEGMPNTAMMARGGHGDLSDDEVKAVVDYMISAAAIDPKTLEAAARYDKHRITDRDFIRLDRNFDGSITPDEIAHDPVLAQNLKRFDENRDGRLSEAEYRNAETVLERERAAVKKIDNRLVSGHQMMWD